MELADLIDLAHRGWPAGDIRGTFTLDQAGAQNYEAGYLSHWVVTELDAIYHGNSDGLATLKEVEKAMLEASTHLAQIAAVFTRAGLALQARRDRLDPNEIHYEHSSDTPWSRPAGCPRCGGDDHVLCYAEGE